MRANEFVTEAVRQRLDPKCWTGKHKEGTNIKGGVRVNNCVPNEGMAEGANREGIDLEVTELPNENQILITAMSHGRTLGRVYFDIFDGQLVASDAEVASEYRGQGIAAIIYDYAKELGWEVIRSGRQTDAGAGFWDKHRAAQHVWEQDLSEEWSEKYKSSINCSHPKGFSQKAHCAGKKKHNESVEMEMVCEDCGMCEAHADTDVNENLRNWFKDKWVRFGPDGKIRGDCARGSESEGKPKCLPQSKAHALGKKGRASAAARKRREDPDANRSGAAINVSTKGKKK